MRFKDEIPYLDTYRIIRGKVDPASRSGEVSWDKGQGIYFNVTWRYVIEPPTGTIEIAYTFRTPRKETNLVYPVSLKSNSTTRNGRGPVRIARWLFFCPLQNKKRKCKQWVQKIYLSEKGYFGCERCAKVFPRTAARDKTLDGLVGRPAKIAKMLSSRIIPIKKKLAILEIANRTIKKHRRMKNRLRHLQRKLAKSL